MKVALVTDTHFGVRNGSSTFDLQASEFFHKQFFPYLKREGIKRVIHLGDVVDRRKYASYVTLSQIRKDFLEPIEQMGLDCSAIAGNHDCYYRNTNEVNALREVLAGRRGISVYWDEPVTMLIGDRNSLLVPWITDSNKDMALRKISLGGELLFGHLELVGFEMTRGQVMEHGMSADLFSNYSHVYSGHYHHKSERGNIHYLGAPYEMTWADYEDPKGFHVLDTDDLSLDFRENPYKMHRKVHVGDTHVDNLANRIVKVVVSPSASPALVDELMHELEKMAPADIQRVDDDLNLDISETSLPENGAGVEEFLKTMTDSLDQPGLYEVMRELYVEARNLSE